MGKYVTPSLGATRRCGIAQFPSRRHRRAVAGGQREEKQDEKILAHGDSVVAGEGEAAGPPPTVTWLGRSFPEAVAQRRRRRALAEPVTGLQRRLREIDGLGARRAAGDAIFEPDAPMRIERVFDAGAERRSAVNELVALRAQRRLIIAPQMRDVFPARDVKQRALVIKADASANRALNVEGVLEAIAEECVGVVVRRARAGNVADEAEDKRAVTPVVAGVNAADQAAAMPCVLIEHRVVGRELRLRAVGEAGPAKLRTGVKVLMGCTPPSSGVQHLHFGTSLPSGGVHNGVIAEADHLDGQDHSQF